MGMGLYTSTHSSPRHLVKVSCNLHAPTALPLRKEPLEPIAVTGRELTSQSLTSGNFVLTITKYRTPSTLVWNLSTVWTKRNALPWRNSAPGLITSRMWNCCLRTALQQNMNVSKLFHSCGSVRPALTQDEYKRPGGTCQYCVSVKLVSHLRQNRVWEHCAEENIWT